MNAVDTNVLIYIRDLRDPVYVLQISGLGVPAACPKLLVLILLEL